VLEGIDNNSIIDAPKSVIGNFLPILLRKSLGIASILWFEQH